MNVQRIPETVPSNSSQRIAWVAAFALAAAACGCVYDAVWGIGASLCFVIAGAVLGACLSFTGRTSRGSNRMAVVLRGACLGVGAWVFSLLSWFALQIQFGGRVSQTLQIAIGALFGAVVGWFACWIARPRTNARRERFRRCLLGTAVVLILAMGVTYLALTGPRELNRYPNADESFYRLPWPSGRTYLCCQSNRGIVSHRQAEEFAYDFAMPVGSDVCAARAGVVSWVVDSHDGNGRKAQNNAIAIDHGDGTIGWYLHVRQAGSYVQVGQHVRRGERIAASGNVGLSLLPHLHFHVAKPRGETLPVAFADVESDRGVPRMFKRYSSGNDP